MLLKNEIVASSIEEKATDALYVSDNSAIFTGLDYIDAVFRIISIANNDLLVLEGVTTGSRQTAGLIVL